MITLEIIKFYFFRAVKIEPLMYKNIPYTFLWLYSKEDISQKGVILCYYKTIGHKQHTKPYAI